MNPLSYVKIAGAVVLAAAIGFLVWNYRHMQSELEAKQAQIGALTQGLQTAKDVNEENLAAMAALQAQQARAEAAEAALDKVKTDTAQTIDSIRKEVRHAPDSKACSTSAPIRAALSRLHIVPTPADGDHQGAGGKGAAPQPAVPAGAGKSGS